MDFRTIRYEKLGAVLRITANRPEVFNAQSRVMILELDEAFRAASEDDATRVIIVAGAGAHSGRVKGAFSLLSSLPCQSRSSKS